MYAPLIGIGGSVALYFFVRFLESHWLELGEGVGGGILTGFVGLFR